MGFSFGPTQADLFLYEAYRSGRFGRLEVAEVLPEVVGELRRTSGRYGLNVAHSGRVGTCTVGPVEIQDAASPAEVRQLVEAVAEAEEISTAVPSVHDYTTSGPGSMRRLLPEGLLRNAHGRGPRAVV